MLKHLKTAVATAFAIVLTAIMASCSNEEDVKNPAATTGAASAMESTLQDSYSAILNADLSLDPDAPASRSTKATIDPSMRAANVYVKMPAYYDRADVAMVQQAHTMDDLWRISKEVGAELSFVETTKADMVLTLSEEKAKEALAPLLAESKRYLYSKGFTEFDIQNMLKATNVSEADLIPLVLGLSRIEQKQNEYIAEKGFTNYVSLSPSDQRDALMNWDGFNDCVLEAFGLVVLEHFFEAIVTKQLTQQVIMETLLFTAKKYSTWIAAGFLVYDVGKCVIQNW